METCAHCGGPVKVIPKALAALAGQALASIEDQQVIDKILGHLKTKEGLPLLPDALPETRAPPQGSLFCWYQDSLMILLAAADRWRLLAFDNTCSKKRHEDVNSGSA